MWLGLFFGLLAKGDVIEMSGDQAFQCHVCTAAEDHLGNPIGQNNIFCGESFVDNLYLTDCAEDQDVCVTDVRIDWIKQGTQIITTVRRCGKSEDDLQKDGKILLIFINIYFIFRAVLWKLSALSSSIQPFQGLFECM